MYDHLNFKRSKVQGGLVSGSNQPNDFYLSSASILSRNMTQKFDIKNFGKNSNSAECFCLKSLLPNDVPCVMSANASIN